MFNRGFSAPVTVIIVQIILTGRVAGRGRWQATVVMTTNLNQHRVLLKAGTKEIKSFN